MDASNTSKNLALIAGWLQRSPDRKAGSSLDVMSLPERLSSLGEARTEREHYTAKRYHRSSNVYNY